MNETPGKRPCSRYQVSPVTGTVVILMAAAFFFFLLVAPPRCVHRYVPSPSVVCRTNLKALSISLIIYANDNGGQYPPAERWCDVLAEWESESGGKSVKEYRDFRACPEVGKDGWGYAMNPLADPEGDPNVVLLFESDAGWNGFGGAELMAMGCHREGVCNVALVNGTAMRVKASELGELKWGDEEAPSSEVRNVRRPEDRKELRYWLENMVWHHRFSTAEVRLATGLSEAEIVAAQERFDIWPDGRPEREPNAPLLVLPYPGGRHPRIGFLEGAIDPQRETKFSVFTPWDANSYVVMDVPEAIWSNLGLTYLAHTHIDTIWTAQGIELPKLEWRRRDDGGLEIERRLPNGIAFGVTVEPGRDAVRMAMWLENGTDAKLSGLRIQNCVMPKMAAGFAGQTNENKVLTNPYVACRSEDGRRWIITAWEGCERPWGNADCPCFHSDPKFPDLEPGQRHVLRGWLSFYEGEDIQGEFERIEATGWREKGTNPKPEGEKGV